MRPLIPPLTRVEPSLRASPRMQAAEASPRRIAAAQTVPDGDIQAADRSRDAAEASQPRLRSVPAAGTDRPAASAQPRDLARFGQPSADRPARTGAEAPPQPWHASGRRDTAGAAGPGAAAPHSATPLHDDPPCWSAWDTAPVASPAENERRLRPAPVRPSGAPVPGRIAGQGVWVGDDADAWPDARWTGAPARHDPSLSEPPDAWAGSRHDAGPGLGGVASRRPADGRTAPPRPAASVPVRGIAEAPFTAEDGDDTIPDWPVFDPAPPPPPLARAVQADAGPRLRRPRILRRAVGADADDQPAPPRARRDPAPSRTSYRMQRLWLTPGFRGLVRTVLPAVTLVTVLALWLTAPEQRAWMAEQAQAVRDSIAARPEFQIHGIEVTGASPALNQAVRDLVPAQFPITSLDVDLVALRAAIEEYDAVAGADLRLTGGQIEVRLREREPALLWRIGGELHVLDATGHRIARLDDRAAFPGLPVVAGVGAPAAAAEALALIEAGGLLGDRLRGLERIGERRWDVVLDRDQRILLPENGALAALERAVALHQAQDLLSRDVVAVDLRLGRPVLRIAPQALPELRRIESLERGTNG